MAKGKQGKGGKRALKGAEQPSGTANPLLWFVNAVGGGQAAATAAGISINPTTAMRCAAVYACVRVVSEDVAKLPLVIYRGRDDGTKAPALDHPLYAVLRRRPNEWQSSFEWREMMQAHLELRGNAYSYIVRDGRGNVTALWPLHPDRVSLRLAPDGDVFYSLSRGANEPSVPMVAPRDAILHLRGMTLDGYHGLSPIAWARETIGLSIAAELHGAAYFGNGARPDIALTAPANADLSSDQIKKIRDWWADNHAGLRRAHRPAVLPTGMTIEKLGITNKDSQFLELRQFQVSDVARLFRIPPHKIGDLSRATFSNVESMALDYFRDGLMPRLERFEAAMERDLLTANETGKFEIEFDFTRMLRGDLKAMMEAIGSGRNWGIISANEARNWLNLPPRDGGDTYLEPVNTMPAGAQQDRLDQERERDPPQISAEPDDGDAAEARAGEALARPLPSRMN